MRTRRQFLNTSLALSATCHYMVPKWKKDKADPELAKKAPVFAYSAGYAKPLFALLEIDPAGGGFSMRGMKSEWLGPSPQEVGYSSADVENEWLRPEITRIELPVS